MSLSHYHRVITGITGATWVKPEAIANQIAELIINFNNRELIQL